MALGKRAMGQAEGRDMGQCLLSPVPWNDATPHLICGRFILSVTSQFDVVTDDGLADVMQQEVSARQYGGTHRSGGLSLTRLGFRSAITTAVGYRRIQRVFWFFLR